MHSEAFLIDNSRFKGKYKSEHFSGTSCSQMWECAIAVCKELVTQCEEEIFDYIQLSSLLKRMSQFYDSIMKQIRPEPEYFRVAYYGRGFPAFLQNKVHV
jgi:dedicator of cytokinesis protein 1